MLSARYRVLRDSKFAQDQSFENMMDLNNKLKMSGLNPFKKSDAEKALKNINNKQ